MNLVQIDPWDFEMPEYLRRVRVAPGELHPYSAVLDPATFYDDDRHLTGAALPLHPLLGKAAVEAVYRVLPFAATVRDWPAGTRFTELGDGTDPAVHLLLRGRVRLVATRSVGGRTRRWVVAQYRPGQWIALLRVLREADRAVRRLGWPEEPHVRLEAEALEPVRTQRLAMEDALALVDAYPDFRRFVEHHVSVRFARRREMLARIAENGLLRLLNPADREYLLQLGAIVCIEDGAGDAYLPAGAPAGKAALVLRGEGALLTPGDGAHQLRYGATLRPGDLVGHEGLVMDAERDDPGTTRVAIVEPSRTTAVRLVPGTEVLQLYWHALRWVLDNRAAVWKRVIRMLAGSEAGVRAPMPTVVGFHAARPGLGTSVLACGTGAALARAGARGVHVIDLRGAENFTARWRPCGFTTAEARVPVQCGPRVLRAEGRPTEIACRALVPSRDVAWPPGLRIWWPVVPDADHVEDLLDALEADPEVSHVIVAGRDADGDGLASQVLGRLHGRCRAVFYVCDDADAPYPGPEPEELTWVYRLTPAYRAAEERHARRVRVDWLFAAAIESVAEPVRRAIEGLLGYSPSAELERELGDGPRRVVRVPDDATGARLFEHGALAALAEPHAERLALGRAFARLARVVDRRTVGLALGGGGAWGFSHVALLRNLEAHGVPVDYIAGTSFGSVVGGLYAVGGMRALDLLVDANSATGPGLAATLRALVGGQLTRALLVAPLSSAVVETFVHGMLRAAGVASGDGPPCLGMTEIPFYPVGTNLGTHEPLALARATVGWGVRMSGSLPPMFPTLPRRWDRIADGAFIANVPSRVVRELGAHFVIAVNVVPPPPAPAPRSLGRDLLTWVPRKILERLEDTVRGVFVLAWKAGQDQGELAADYALDLLPTAANLFEMWRGRDIVDEIQAKHFEGEKARRIRDAWDRFAPDARAR
jgi:predicted acylesterase/phospholipase RssA/CRP-like cAMP-binding protein